MSDAYEISAASENYFLGVSMDPVAANNNNRPTAGEVYLQRIRTSVPGNAFNLWLGVTSAGSGMTANQCFGCVYDANGKLLARTADISSSMTSSGPKKLPLKTLRGVGLSTGMVVYAGFLLNGTTMPQIMGAGQGMGWSGNLGPGIDGYPSIAGPYTALASKRYRFMSFSSGLTDLPDSIDLSYGNPDQAFFLGLSV